MADGQEALRRRAQRQATVAAFARPLQHDINNLLMVVTANVDLLLKTAKEPAQQRQLDRIAQAARRLEAGTRAVLSLARRPVPAEGPVVLAQALKELAPLLQLLLPTDQTVAMTLAPDATAPVALDRAALEEALLALAQDLAAKAPRGPGLALALEAAGPMLVLHLDWPEGVAPPAPELVSHCAGLGEFRAEGRRLSMAWPRG